MFGLSFWEIGMILVVALVVLGPKRLPAVARFLGQALRTLRRASSDLRVAVREPLKEVQQPLEELRADIYETVHHFERHVEQSARVDDVTEMQDTETPAALPGSQAGRLDLEGTSNADEEAEQRAAPPPKTEGTS